MYIRTVCEGKVVNNAIAHSHCTRSLYARVRKNREEFCAFLPFITFTLVEFFSLSQFVIYFFLPNKVFDSLYCLGLSSNTYTADHGSVFSRNFIT